MSSSRVTMLALLAIMVAVTAVFTLLVRVPIPGTPGYFNFSDVAITFTAVTFGGLPGLVAGGLGAAIADLLGGYPQWAVLTLLAHGLEGWVMGILAGRRTLSRLVIAWLAGSLTMIAIYFLGEGLVLTGWGPAITELPYNAVQALAGGVVGIPLYYAVRRAYPPVMRLAGRQE